MATDHFNAKDAADASIPFATDTDTDGNQHQYVKVEFGAENTQTPVSASNPLPVSIIAEVPVGTKHIGSVDIDNYPPSARDTDSVAAALQTGVLMSGLTALTPKFKNQAVTASQTDTSVVAAVTSKKIRVLAAFLQAGGTATDVTFESDDAVTDTTVWKLTLAANGGAVLPFSPLGWFETDAGEALIVTTGAGSTIQITLVYAEI